jgi:hypothetical protein
MRIDRGNILRVLGEKGAMIRKTSLMLFVFVAISSMFAVEIEKITVTRSSVRGPYSHSVWLDADLAGKSVELMCYVRQQSCAKLAPGKYMLIRLKPGDGIYQDCENVDIFRVDADPTKDQPLGEYCVMQP